MSKIAQLNALRWNGVMFGFIVGIEAIAMRNRPREAVA